MKTTVEITLFGETREVEVQRWLPWQAETVEAVFAWRVGHSGQEIYHTTASLVPLEGDTERYADEYRRGGLSFPGSDGVEYGLQSTKHLTRGRGNRARIIGWADKFPATAL